MKYVLTALLMMPALGWSMSIAYPKECETDKESVACKEELAKGARMVAEWDCQNQPPQSKLSYKECLEQTTKVWDKSFNVLARDDVSSVIVTASGSVIVSSAEVHE